MSNLMRGSEGVRGGSFLLTLVGACLVGAMAMAVAGCGARQTAPDGAEDTSGAENGSVDDTAAGPMDLNDADFVVMSGPASPRVAYALQRSGKTLRVALDVAAFSEDGSGTAVELGLDAAQKTILDDSKAKIEHKDGRARYTYTVPASDLVKTEADWKKLRMAVAVRWSGGFSGQDRQRERFGNLDRGAPHAGLSQDSRDWMPLDLGDYASTVADRKSRIAVPFEQPMDGKATIVIEDKDGKRIRNLVSGVKMPDGRQEVEWDGADDGGNLVAPGTYHWRSIHHPGITPEYLMSFANGGERFTFPFGSNHNLFSQATANDKYVFLAAGHTEGGYALVALDRNGTWKHGYGQIHGTGIFKVALPLTRNTFTWPMTDLARAAPGMRTRQRQRRSLTTGNFRFPSPFPGSRSNRPSRSNSRADGVTRKSKPTNGVRPRPTNIAAPGTRSAGRISVSEAWPCWTASCMSAAATPRLSWLSRPKPAR